MTIRVIFAPLMGRKSDKFVLSAAHSVARRFNAHVDAAFLGSDPRNAIPYLGENISGVVIERLIEQAESEVAERALEARTEFNEWREASGLVFADSVGDRLVITESENEIPSCSWQEIIGVPEYNAASAGKLADLTISTRGDTSGETENESLLEFAVMESSRPLLLAPPLQQDEIGKRVTVAWDGSPEAARAVGAAMPFLQTAEAVCAVAVTEEGKAGSSVDDLAHYLSWHGIQTDTRTSDVGDLSIGEAILGEALRESSDLLVMGAYGHNRYRELIFGGVTRYILDECMLPVLLAH